MRNLGELWRAIHEKERHNIIYEKRVIVGDQIYYDHEISGLSKDAQLIGDDITIGQCPSARFKVTIIERPNITIPRNARVEYQKRASSADVPHGHPYLAMIEGSKYLAQIEGSEYFARLATVKTGVSDWITFGTYYVDTRENVGDSLSLTCYDSMMFAEQPFMNNDMILQDFPLPVNIAMSHILGAVGIELDPRTKLDPRFMLNQHPVGASMRSVLGYIAASHSGNFHITDENRLRLVVPQNNTPLFELTGRHLKKRANNPAKTISKLYFVINEDGEYHEAGTGDTSLEVINVFATLEITRNVLSQLETYTYEPFNLSSVELDPAHELGDSFLIEGRHCNLWAMRMSDRVFFDIFAPTRGDTDREFPHQSKIEEMNARRRQANDARWVEMTLTLDQFRVAFGDDLNSLRSEMTLTLDQFRVAITNDVDGVRSELNQTANRLSWIVASGTDSSNFTLTDRTMDLISSEINIRGFVTFTNLATPGQTTIDGENIIAGTISVNRIYYRVGTEASRVFNVSGAVSNPVIEIGLPFINSGTGISRFGQMSINANNIRIEGELFTELTSRSVSIGRTAGIVSINADVSNSATRIGTVSSTVVIGDSGSIVTLGGMSSTIIIGGSNAWQGGVVINGAVRVGNNGDRVGFFGVTPQTRSVVIGNNTDSLLWSLLGVLSSLGLIIIG